MYQPSRCTDAPFVNVLVDATSVAASISTRQMRGRTEMFYGLVGLFLMGLGIRAVLQAG